MRIRRIDTAIAQDVERFIEAPFELYRGDPRWAPPFVAEVRLSLNRLRHPFYLRSEADFFLAEDGGRVLGRIGAMNNRLHNAHHGTRDAFFGFFEASPDPAVSRGLLRAVGDWARERGLNRIRGPRDLLRLDRGGVMVEGFEARQTMGLAYNPPQYDGLLRDSGFRKETDYLTCQGHVGQRIPDRAQDIARRAAARRGLTTWRPSGRRELARWLPRLMDLYRQSFEGDPAYYARSPEEEALAAQMILALVEPRLTVFVLREGEPVGFMLGCRDLSDGLRPSRGGTRPFAWARLLLARRRSDLAKALIYGVLPAWRSLGVGSLLVIAFNEACLALGARIEGELVEEGNLRSLGLLESVGCNWVKRHRQYCRELE